MIRGVSRNIIEISDTGNDCFERAILFVRPGRGAGDSHDLTERAKEYMQNLRVRRGLFRRSRFSAVASALISAAIGCGLTAAFFLLL